jgi:hypothetical protein
MMAVFMLADWHPTGGSIEVVLFPRTYKKAVDQLAGWETPRELVEGEIFAVGGTLDLKRGSPQIIADGIMLGGETVKPRDANAGFVPPPSEFVSTAFDDDMPIYDDEAGGEVVVYAPAPQTQNGNGRHNGNGNGHAPRSGSGNGSSHHTSEVNIFADLFGEVEQKAVRHIRVYFQRTGNLEADEFRLRRLYGEIISQNGDDSFSIITENGPDDPKLWEFELTTRYDRDLLNRIAALVGENNIVVR